jgi:hypothetical protein
VRDFRPFYVRSGVMNGPKATSAFESVRLPTPDIGRRGPQVAFVPILLQKSVASFFGR